MKQLFHGLTLRDDHQVRCNFIEGHKDKCALRQPGVGKVEAGLVDDEVAKQQQIQIEGAGSVRNTCGTVAPKLALDGQQPFEKLARAQAGLDAYNRIHEAGLVGQAHRFSRVEGGAAD